MKANFIDNNDIFFSNRQKIGMYLIFPSQDLASSRVKTRPKVMQDSEAFALKLEDASLTAIVFALIENFIVQLYCVQIIVRKSCF